MLTNVNLKQFSAKMLNRLRLGKFGKDIIKVKKEPSGIFLRKPVLKCLSGFIR